MVSRDSTKRRTPPSADSGSHTPVGPPHKSRSRGGSNGSASASASANANNSSNSRTTSSSKPIHNNANATNGTRRPNHSNSIHRRQSPPTSHMMSRSKSVPVLLPISPDEQSRMTRDSTSRSRGDSSFKSKATTRSKESHNRSRASTNTNSSRPRNPSKPQQHNPQQQQQQQQQQQVQRRKFNRENVEGLEDDAEKEGALSPEMLVDALSGQADGLVSIAERLMEYYDDGYDAMGEAIIDAFADVQKLFQHVVEAAHMEGAAFEASRRDAEKLELDNNNTSKHNITMTTDDDPTSRTSMGKAGGPLRHDELIDQDVKDLLSEALNEGVHLKEKGELTVCYRKYEEASQSASAMLPVDSEHRGRLQLAITRADAMHPARGCAILKYAMDDVIRSGLRPGNHSLPDPSKRSDCVLTKPKDDSNLNDSGGVSQSSEEVLANLVAEMKEVTGAPIYNDTPLQSVATRFWDVLAETQTSQAKKEQSLEHELGQQKGEFLLARAEWEEKLNESKLEIKKYKKKFNKLRETKRGEDYMEQARASSVVLTESRQDEGDNINNTANINPKKSSSRTFSSMGSTPGSVASIGSSMAQHAKTLVREFNCGIMNDRTKTVVNDSMDDEERNKFCENVKKEKTILKLPKEPRVSGTNGSSKGSMSIRTPGESTKRQTAEI